MVKHSIVKLGDKDIGHSSRSDIC